MRNSPFWFILIGIMILLDVYVFQAIKLVSQSAGSRTRLIVYSVYWSISVLAILTIIFLPLISSQFNNLPKAVRSSLFAIVVGLFFGKLIAAVFFLVDDLRRLIQWFAGRIFFSGTEGETMQQSDKISRSAFMSWLGLVAGGGLFGTLLYGFNNKYRYQVKRLELAFHSLPATFKGLKIVHISDIHCGSFNNKEAVMRGVDKIMKEQPDLILFTGDLVNDHAGEMDNYIEVFNKLSAPLGVYSTLGNHDYGDYIGWDTRDAKSQNLEKLKQVHQEMGWRLLMNEHVVLQKGEEKIALLGVENWSAKARFPKYGSLEKAYAGAESYPFKILMSHDPSHWEAEVLKEYKDVNLMLAGHTHGLQFGVELPGFRWSPVQYIYKHWAGLYEEASQKLYVNRGFGFIGYPGRVGILPEITVLQLV